MLHWQVLDDKNMALQDALTWAWVRPGEQRTCVGCHEDRETIAGLSQVPLAALRPPTPLNVPEEERHTIDFRRDLTPIIEAKCVRCHDAAGTAGGLDLSEGDKLVFQQRALRPDSGAAVEAALFNKAYLNLSINATSRIGKLIFPGLARKSPLIWRLYGHSPLYNATVNQCPPDQPLTDEEKEKFALWVDLGAQWDNFPGEDSYISYTRDDSRRLADKVSRPAAAVITDAVAATETRCTLCHDLSKPLGARKTAAEWKELVNEMAEKQEGWVNPQEIDLIARFLPQITEDAGLLRDWKVCGPFDNRNGAGIRNQYGPESEIDYAMSYPGKGGSVAAWKDVTLHDPTAVLDFNAVLGSVDQATAYAATTIHSNEDKVVFLRTSGDNMFEVIVNGEKVLQRLMRQPFRYDNETLAVALKEGDNTLLVKVHNLNGQWRLRARLTESPSPVARAAVLGVSDVVGGGD